MFGVCLLSAVCGDTMVGNSMPKVTDEKRELNVGDVDETCAVRWPCWSAVSGCVAD